MLVGSSAPQRSGELRAACCRGEVDGGEGVGGDNVVATRRGQGWRVRRASRIERPSALPRLTSLPRLKRVTSLGSEGGQSSHP